MTQAFSDMLFLLGEALGAPKVSFDHEPDIEKIYKHSVRQSVWSIIYETAKEHFGSALTERQRNLSITQIVKHSRRVENVISLVKRLSTDGIDCVFLKGIAAARLYPVPENRISGDVDVLIPQNSESTCKKLLQGYGFQNITKSKNSNHFVLHDDNCGIVEFHTVPLNPRTTEFIVRGSVDFSEPVRIVSSGSLEIRVMGLYDEFFFLLFHYMKHFLSGGTGIRQVADIAMYLNFYRNELDMNRIFAVTDKLHYTGLVKAIAGTSNRYFGTAFPYADYESLDSYLNDIEKTPTFSYDMALFDSYAMKCMNFSRKEYISGMKNDRPISTMKKIFPKSSALKEVFPYAERHSWLLPLAWVNRIIILTGKLFTGERDVRKMVTYVPESLDSDEVKARISLLSGLGITEDKK